MWPVLARMVNDAARYYKQNGQMYLARYRLLMGWAFEGLPPENGADFRFSHSSGSLAEWKRRLFIVSIRLTMVHVLLTASL